MREISPSLFDLYALALPSGLAFADNLPVGAWSSEDGTTIAALTQNDQTDIFGCLVMRRRVDGVWSVLLRETCHSSREEVLSLIRRYLAGNPPKEPIPPGTSRRPSLGDVEGVETSKIFQALAQPTRHVAAWVLNQLYLALPAPDKNWARDCQTENFHTRLWEAHLNACFREQGLLVKQNHTSPDFHISNHFGGQAWVEAVTTNPPVRYDHYGAEPTGAPEDRQERMIGPAAVRFAKTIRNKLVKRYDQMPHVIGNPFAIAVADFQAPSSMVWTRTALPSYLYGFYAKVVERDGIKVAESDEVRTLLGEEGIPAGLFCSEEHSELSAVIFSSGCTMAKLSRVGVSSGAEASNYRYVRVGEFYDRTPGALVGLPFSMDVTSDEYRALWSPYDYEPWSAELEVFHNPYARYPIPDELMPEATHWRWINGEGICRAFYETSILYSRTVILPADKPIPTFTDVFGGKRDSGASE
jgi:hypothetical protein